MEGDVGDAEAGRAACDLGWEPEHHGVIGGGAAFCEDFGVARMFDTGEGEGLFADGEGDDGLDLAPER